MDKRKLEALSALEKKVLWLSTWMIHNANHLRENTDGLKVGGHQASSASLATIMTALYFSILRPQDRIAVKPHASPVFHAIQYLLGNQTREKLEGFRAFGGAQSYPSRTKDVDDVDFSTGSVGLGVAQTLFASLVQDYLVARDEILSEGRMVALIGDAEMDEGNIFEALLEGWKHGLRNCWWIVDYNRQSLDAVVREGLWERFENIFRNFGWDVVILKYGSLLDAAFAEPGGEALKVWIDACPNQLYSALIFQGGGAWRKRLLADICEKPGLKSLLERRSDAELAALMTNLGGHDLPCLIEAFETARGNDQPTCFIAYTIKGFCLPLAGHKDNHAGLMTRDQMEVFRASMSVREGREWDAFEGLDIDERDLRRFLDAVPFAAKGHRRRHAQRIVIPDRLVAEAKGSVSTQVGFGRILDEIARAGGPLADAIVTASPDVTVSTNLGPWVNRRGLFSRRSLADMFRSERIASTQKWEFGTSGQHIELGIAENNLFILLSALGLSHSIFGKRLLPIGTLYDPFIQRGLDALNYACYQDARFLLVATPSGVTLAPEGGAHQSIATQLIGMAQDGLAAYEPAFVDELAVIMRFALDYMQRDGEVQSERTWLRDETGGSVYLRLSTRPVEQITRSVTPVLEQDIIDGGYWLRPPGPNAEVIVAYTGAVAPEAIEAIGMMAEDRRDVGLLAVTSADRLNAGWTAASRARERGLVHARSHVERLFANLPAHCAIVTVTDGHPAALGWLGSVYGHRTRSLGVEHFGQSGTIGDLYRHFGIDANSIATAADRIAGGRPIRYLRALD
ncbi:transketolase [Mesorhizobium sp. C280B]|uniref:transketolase-like TK C-terminal-containing protein n=1 Tax=unclassified Mesorhizobium TaxID=325217 RepID=UPI0003CEC774|nr:1-deoxy-D-xylulose-5-phosphate synthase N-terminal domain-containing protein [Mesorhizobium sp. LSJC280B00]ESW78966.1 transketolase [Mesorhizobium sp. LSJC280B00]